MRMKLLCHTNPDFYGIWTAFIGARGGFEYIDQNPIFEPLLLFFFNSH